MRATSLIQRRSGRDHGAVVDAAPNCTGWTVSRTCEFPKGNGADGQTRTADRRFTKWWCLRTRSAFLARSDTSRSAKYRGVTPPLLHGLLHNGSRRRVRNPRITTVSGLENRYVLRGVKGSNPFPSAVNRAFPPSSIASSASQYHNAYHNQRRMASHRSVFDLAKSAGARRDVTGARPRVCPGVAAHGRDERSTRPGSARRPLATVSKRGARRGWGEWVEP